MARFRKGEIKFLFSINQLKEGFDEPSVDAIMMMNFTKSVSDYIQILGRGLRQHESKEYAIIVDYLPNKYSKVNPLIASVALGENIPQISKPKDESEPKEKKVKDEKEVSPLGEKKSRDKISQSYFETIKSLYVPINKSFEIINKRVGEKLENGSINLPDDYIIGFIDKQIKKGLDDGEEIQRLIVNRDMDLDMNNPNYLEGSFINQLDVFVNIPNLIIAENAELGFDESYFEKEVVQERDRENEKLEALELKLSDMLGLINIFEEKDLEEMYIMCSTPGKIYKKLLAFVNGEYLNRLFETEKGIFIKTKFVELDLQNKVESKALEVRYHNRFSEILKLLLDATRPIDNIQTSNYFSNLRIDLDRMPDSSMNTNRDYLEKFVSGEGFQFLNNTELGNKIKESYKLMITLEEKHNKEALERKTTRFTRILTILESGKPFDRDVAGGIYERNGMYEDLLNFASGAKEHSILKNTELGNKLMDICEAKGIESYR